jgi:tetratricopeptide (TPR) repeat protein
MSILKAKIFLPLCVAGVLTGYAAAEYLMPRYFHPPPLPPEQKLTMDDILNAIGQQPHYFRKTTSGSYLAGQFAQRHKDWGKADDYIESVFKQDQDNPSLQKHSMILSMAAGDVKESIGIAQTVLKNDPKSILAILFSALEPIKNNDYKATLDTLGMVDEENLSAFIVPAVKLWAEAGLGNFSVDQLTPNSFYAYQALLVGLYMDKNLQAVDFADASFKSEENDIRDLEKYADAFLAFGKIDRALAIYELIVQQNYADSDLKNKIKRLKNNEAIESIIEVPKVQSPTEGIALVFQDMAEILLREFSDDSATIFAQMALYLDPTLNRNHAMIAEVYERHERYNKAIDTLKKIDSEDELFPIIQRQIAELYAKQEDDEKAIEILENLYTNNNDIDAKILIGDLYRYQEDYSKSAEAYSEVLARWNDTPPEEYWHVLYARGMSLERLKKFEAAEVDLLKALAFRPNNPYVLNYLGYSWVDQGIHLEKSLGMIAQAVSILPNDGYITDSLGWVHYKMGNYKEAVPHLERAVALLPYDATINDHLGDAYWKVGRQHEARFQWQRALNYNENEDMELKQKIQEKLITGLNEEDTVRVTEDKTSGKSKSN